MNQISNADAGDRDCERIFTNIHDSVVCARMPDGEGDELQFAEVEHQAFWSGSQRQVYGLARALPLGDIPQLLPTNRFPALEHPNSLPRRSGITGPMSNPEICVRD